MSVFQAAQQELKNFSVLVSHVLVPPAISAILDSPLNRVQGFLGPGHVCTVMGYEEYEPLAAKYHVPIARAQPGDAILISGSIAVHGIAIMPVREGLEFKTEIASDSAPLNGLVEAILAACPDVHVLRDPTRGGVTSALTEIAQSAGVGIHLDEARVPIDEAVKGACEILGLDPLYVANEGNLLAIVPAAAADNVLAGMRAHEFGKNAAIIGEVTADSPGVVLMKTRIGGTRIVDVLSGEQLPRIC